MQVRRNEGIAIHIGPEPCGHIREGVIEASVGVRVGQPLSHEIIHVPGADLSHCREGNIAWCAIASAMRTRRGRRTWHARMLLAREPGDLQSGRGQCTLRSPRIGKVRSRSR